MHWDGMYWSEEDYEKVYGGNVRVHTPKKPKQNILPFLGPKCNPMKMFVVNCFVCQQRKFSTEEPATLNLKAFSNSHGTTGVAGGSDRTYRICTPCKKQLEGEYGIGDWDKVEFKFFTNLPFNHTTSLY